jgi:lipopolysaccharide transport system ATP-binding protein
MNAIVRVQNVSKQFRIGEREAVYETLRETITSTVRAPFRKLKGLNSKRNSPTIWALKDVSFEISAGETLGIIGHNGAGKSTLLKVLSRITQPTSGRVELYGRVASLLEVGTGFHPELTGKENIFLNGAILGMRKSEIRQKFDEIVAFAEIDAFIDTPVKYYSSGMYVRLAFAVAAHLEPEILIVDEVLAVGDAEFQKKCLGKMSAVAKGGRTVLFVSHNMSAISRLCSRVILLGHGVVERHGPVHDVIGHYLSSVFNSVGFRSWPDDATAPGNGIVRLRSLRVHDKANETRETLDIRQSVAIEMQYEVLSPGHVLIPNLHFYNEHGVCVFVLHDFNSGWRRRSREIGAYTTTAWIPGNFLAEGRLTVGAAITTYTPMHIHFYEQDAVAFQVVDSLEGDSARGDYVGHIPGVVRPIVDWNTAFSPDRELLESRVK